MIARLGVAVASLTLFAAASPAQASPVPVQGWNGLMDLPAVTAKGSMLWTLGQDCISLEEGGWKIGKSLHPKSTTLVQLQTDTLGSLDGSTAVGDVHEKKAISFGFHNLTAQPDRLLEIHDLGVEMQGSRAYLTGRLVKGKPLFSAAKRVRLATIAHPRFVAGNATVPRHPDQTIPDTFLMSVQGDATLAAPLAKALDRIRCHPNRYFAIHPRPVRPGVRFGFVSIQFEPGAAFGAAGAVATSPEFETSDNTPLTASAIAPATLGKAGIGLPLPDGAHVPLECRYGGRCRAPAGTQFGVAGGMTVASPDGHSATIDTMQLTAGPEGKVALITGRVNGQQMDLATDQGTTQEFLQALSAALGVSVVGAYLGPTVTFTKLAPG